MEVEKRCFEAPWTPGQFRHEIKVPFSRTLLAWDDRTSPSRLAGYVCRWIVGDEVSILNLAVDPDYQRQGLGRALVQLIADEAESLGARSITLEVREKNDAAGTLYRTMGFAQKGMRRDYYGKGDHAVIMTRELPAEQLSEEALCPNPDGGV